MLDVHQQLCKMLCRGLILAAFCVLQSIGGQEGIKIVYDDIIISKWDKNYFTSIDSYVTDDSENSIVLQFTLIKDLPAETQGHFVLLSSTMGQYIVPTGLDLTMPLCDMLAEPIILAPALNVFGFTADNCPPVVGVYGSEGYLPPTDRFPDDFPPDKYLGLLELVDENNKKLIVVKIYLEVR